MKPETLKSILSLVRNADSRTSSAVVTSQGRDTATDDVTCAVDTRIDDVTESSTRLATEGEPCRHVLKSNQ